MKPKISVIISTYNREKLLQRAIDSVLAQTFKDFEYIIVDDGSTDNTREIIRKYEIKDTDKYLLEKYIGGKGLGFAILDKIAPNPDPFSPENPLIFINGPFTGTKIQTETFQGLAGKGALGSALRLEAEAINPWTGRQGSLDPVLALRKVGLGLASIPAEAGQLIGSSTARFFGQKTSI